MRDRLPPGSGLVIATGLSLVFGLVIATVLSLVFWVEVLALGWL